MVVYADILICVNLIVNYALLAVTARFCRRSPHRMRALAGAFLGALYALLLFARTMPGWGMTLSKFAVSALMVRMALPWISWKEYLRRLATFWVVGLLFAGAMLALWLFAAPRGMLYSNGVVYFDISAVALVGFTALAYGIAEVFSRIYQKKGADSGMYQVVVELGQKRALLRGFLDTGNSLSDVYTGYPIAVCHFEPLRGVLPASLWELFEAILRRGDYDAAAPLLSRSTSNKFKLVPFHTVGFSGVLPAFLPDRMELCQGGRRFVVENVYLAVTAQPFAGGEYDLLLGPLMLPHECAPPLAGGGPAEPAGPFV